jgi:SAM-dependent methyltransferase
MAEPYYRAAGQDWLAIWRTMYDAERAQGEAATHPEFARYQDHWQGQAARFAKFAAESPQPDGFMRFLLPRLRPTDRLIDIGAGPGRYEPLLCQHVAEVLAVEPSPSLRAYLADRCGPNGRVIAESWPEAAVPASDIVIAAHVLYSVREIGPFIERMHAVAQRGWYLLLAYQHPMSYAAPFWQAIHGEERLPLPGALECLAALYQLGIPANLSLIPIDIRMQYASKEQVLIDLYNRLRIPPDPKRDAQLSALIDEHFEPLPNGAIAPHGLPEQSAVLWWEQA